MVTIVATAPLSACASTSARSAAGVTSGASPLTTTTGPSPTSSSAAANTAPPVPFAAGCTARTTPSGSRPSSAPSGEPTTTTLPAPASTAAPTVQSIIGRPQISWSIFGVRERMRVPWPAARITTVGAVTGVRLEGGRNPPVRGAHVLEDAGVVVVRAGAATRRRHARTDRRVVCPLELVRPLPLADRIAADAIRAPDGRVAERLDLTEKLVI